MRRTRRVWLSALTAVLLLPMRDATSNQAAPNGSSDGISGTWSDACSCSIPCPCWQTGRANVPHCLNVQVFQPSVSSFPDGDSAFVLVGNSEGYWAPSQYTLYFDNSTEALLDGKLSGFVQKYYGISPASSKRVTIKVVVSPNMRRLEISGILHYHIESTHKAALSETVRNYLYDWLLKPEQWKTKVLSYRSGLGQVIEFKGTSSLVARFHLKPEDLQVVPVTSGIVSKQKEMDRNCKLPVSLE